MSLRESSQTRAPPSHEKAAIFCGSRKSTPFKNLNNTADSGYRNHGLNDKLRSIPSGAATLGRGNRGWYTELRSAVSVRIIGGRTMALQDCAVFTGERGLHSVRSMRYYDGQYDPINNGHGAQ